MIIHFPLQYREEGLTEAHKEIIRYASKQGDVVVGVVPRLLDWGNYLLNGIGYPMEKEIEAMVPEGNLLKDTQELNVELRFYPPVRKSEEERLAILNRAEAVVEEYRGQLLLDRYIRQAKIHLMNKCLLRVGRVDCSIRGPDMIGFFIKKIGQTMKRRMSEFQGSSIECQIFPKIIKDKNNFRQHGSASSVPSYYKDAMERLSSAIGGFKDKCSVGSNEKLVEEVNSSYSHKPWKIQDITIFEGGLIDGRLEVVGITLPFSGGILLLEDVEYYV